MTIPGVHAHAWPRDLLLEFIADEVSSSFVILGSDVISHKNGKMIYTYDNWSVDGRNISESFNDYCKGSLRVANEYLKKYPIKG